MPGYNFEYSLVYLKEQINTSEELNEFEQCTLFADFDKYF